MKLFALIPLVILALISGLQSEMKFKELYTVETGLQPGIPIYDTGQGWLLAGTGKGVFANRIFKLEDNGEIAWFKSFAYKPVSMTTKSGRTIMLDELGNFYLMDSDGSMISNITEVVTAGRNVIAFGSGETVYASGDDNSVTCFQTDGNIEWMATGKGEVTYLLLIENNVLVSEKGDALVCYSLEGEEKWRVPVDGFASNAPVVIGNDIIWGLRNQDGSKGKIVSLSFDGKKNWETDIKKGVDYIFAAGDGYMAIGSLLAAEIDKNGKIIWQQPFDGSRKLYPMGFNDDGRLVLGILNPDGDDESLKITLLHPEGSIAVVGKIPIKKNTLVNVSRRGRLVLVGLKDKIVVYKLLTMKEFIEGES